jgi:Bacterial PH domain
MTFPSKRDWWLMLILIAITVIQAVAGVAILWTGPERWPGIILLISAGFIVWLVATTYYVVGETDLLIRCGPFWWTVCLTDIEEITPTWNPLSSPALSLDRLWITYHIGKKKRAIMISPLDKARFVLAIVEKAPALRVEGNKAVKS